MSENDVYHIRPAARIIHTIGEDLIGDPYAALVELVKNSYDADASEVSITFEIKDIEEEPNLFITVKDNGHGMSFDTVVNKWLVPATDDKLIRKKSPIGRVLQGRKGIGRFSAAILGQETTLISIDELKKQSTIYIDWTVFDSNQYLSNVDILIDREAVSQHSGTSIEIIARDTEEDKKLSYWSQDNIKNLVNELRKLISPFQDLDEDKFNISLEFINFELSELDSEIKIETYPIIEFYDYRIHGVVNFEGLVELTYENNKDINAKQISSVSFKADLKENESLCGEVGIDIRVFDRESKAIDNLISKGLKNPNTNEPIGKREARRELDEVYGVNIYKNEFRIRPYGNKGVDWLQLDNRRIQNPSLRIGNNQVVGFITIQSEEQSNLQEKSARDGLKENDSFNGLISIIRQAVSELETKRFTYRERAQEGRTGNISLNEFVQDLFSFDVIKEQITSKLEDEVKSETIDDIVQLLSKEEEEKTQKLEYIKEKIAIYQGQATLGKIVGVILHEGRKPLQFFNSESNNIKKYIEKYKKTEKEEFLNYAIESLVGYKSHANNLSGLFRRVTPLAKQKRNRKKNFSIHSTITECFKVFEIEINSSGISYDIDIQGDISLLGVEIDLFTAITNLIENSIYWLKASDKTDKKIAISAKENNGITIIDYKDNGPGINDEEIESEIIFEPGYTKKNTDDATGLGLAIAGEAVERLNGKLSAINFADGAHFIIKIGDK